MTVKPKRPSPQATLASLGRVALLDAVRVCVPPDALCEGGEWRGPEAEGIADNFMRTLPTQGPPKLWDWPVRIQALLEDGTPITAWHAVNRNVASPSIRNAMALHMLYYCQDKTSLLEQRREYQRRVELLLGESVVLAMATPWPPQAAGFDRRAARRPVSDYSRPQEPTNANDSGKVPNPSPTMEDPHE